MARRTNSNPVRHATKKANKVTKPKVAKKVEPAV